MSDGYPDPRTEFGYGGEPTPKPDDIVRYVSGEFLPLMFHFAAESASAKDTAYTNGFDVKIVAMHDELPEDHPLVTEYDAGSSKVVRKWKPVEIEGWRLVGKIDTEDGPHAQYVRPRKQ